MSQAQGTLTQQPQENNLKPQVEEHPESHHEPKKEVASEAAGAKVEDANDDLPPPLEKVENQPETSTDTQQKTGKGKQSRSEKKSRKAVQKLGMKLVSGITHVTIKRNSDVFVISDPDVYRAPSEKSLTWVIFGVANIKNLSNQAAVKAAEQFKAAEGANAGAEHGDHAGHADHGDHEGHADHGDHGDHAGHADHGDHGDHAGHDHGEKKEGTTAGTSTASVHLEEEKGPSAAKIHDTKDADISATVSHAEPNQVDLIMEQTGVSRETAVKALEDAKGSMVDAIMNLTVS